MRGFAHLLEGPCAQVECLGAVKGGWGAPVAVALRDGYHQEGARGRVEEGAVIVLHERVGAHSAQRQHRQLNGRGAGTGSDSWLEAGAGEGSDGVAREGAAGKQPRAARR